MEVKKKAKDNYVFQDESYLDIRFDNPLRDFKKDLKGDTVNEIITQWIVPHLDEGEYEKDDSLFISYINSYIYGLPARFNKGKLYVSGLFRIVRKIQYMISFKMPSYTLDEDVFGRLLMGNIIHEYYSIGSKGEDLLRMIYKTYKSKNRNNPSLQKSIVIIFEILVASYTETTLSRIKKRSLSFGAFHKNLKQYSKGKGNLESLLQEAESLGKDSIYNIQSHKTDKSYNILKISGEGMQEAKRLFPNNPEIIKGIKEVRIRRYSYRDPSMILNAIVKVIYHKEDLFLIFSPSDFTMGIYDKKHIKTSPSNPCIILNLTDIVQFIFPNDSIEKLFKKEEEVFTSKKKIKPEAIKEMFDEVYKLLDYIHPDDVTIIAKGKVNDNKRIKEVKDALPFAKVGHDRRSGQDQGVIFEIEKQLQKYSKKV